MSKPVLGRNARLLKSGIAIGYGKNISVKAPAGLHRCDYNAPNPADFGVPPPPQNVFST
jgi:hypothetical protein